MQAHLKKVEHALSAQNKLWIELKQTHMQQVSDRDIERSQLIELKEMAAMLSAENTKLTSDVIELV